MDRHVPVLSVPPWSLSGTVVAALLNHRPVWDAIGPAAHQRPYSAPPRAPVLAVMPRHTQVFDGQPIAVPARDDVEDDGVVEVGVALGMVLGRTACRVPPKQALACVAGYLVVGELSLPAPPGAPEHYRPGARRRALDGFCPLGRHVVPAAEIEHPDALPCQVEIDGRLVQVTDTGDRLRGAARLLADVSAFMTLHPGDVLTLGRSYPPSRACVGQRIRLSIEGLGATEHRLVPDMSRAGVLGGPVLAEPTP